MQADGISWIGIIGGADILGRRACSYVELFYVVLHVTPDPLVWLTLNSPQTGQQATQFRGWAITAYLANDIQTT